MMTVIMETKDLPEVLASKIKSMKVEVVETEEGVLLRPLAFKSSLRGLFAGMGFTTERFLRQKEEDKELER